MSDQLAELLAEMSLQLLEQKDVPETAAQVAELGLRLIDSEYVGVVFTHGGATVETAAGTHPLVADLHAVQDECDEGPGQTVFSEQLSVVVPDTLAEERWPQWGRCMAEKGIRSLLSARLYTSTHTIGALNFFDSQPGRFDAESERRARIFARHASVALTGARNLENLWQAIDGRKLIGQAQGMMMERFEVNEEQAFAVLLRYSQDRNIKLRAVAEQLVSTGRLPGQTERVAPAAPA